MIIIIIMDGGWIVDWAHTERHSWDLWLRVCVRQQDLHRPKKSIPPRPTRHRQQLKIPQHLECREALRPLTQFLLHRR